MSANLDCPRCGRVNSGPGECWFCGWQIPPPTPTIPDGEPYAGNLPPHVRTSATSRAMAVASQPGRKTLKQGVVAKLQGTPSTDDELEQMLERSHQSVSSARRALVKQGIVWPLLDMDGVPITRPTRYGNQAQVWYVREPNGD